MAALQISADIRDTNANELITFTATSSAINQIKVANAAAGGAPSINAEGGDTNINVNIVGKGTGRFQVGAVNVPTISSTDTLTNKTLDTATLTTCRVASGGSINDHVGNEQIKFTTAGSATNFVHVKNSATGAGVGVEADGSDTNIDMLLVAKGTGVVKADADEVVVLAKAQTLTNKTLTTPTIGDQSNAGHTHGNTAGGGKLTNAALTAGTFGSVTGVGTQGIALNMGSNLISNVANGVSAQDAVTKSQLDLVSQNLDFKNSCRLVTVGALPTYNQSGTGTGATLTAVANGVLTIDGVASAINDRILVKNAAAGQHNGIYKVTTAGALDAAFVLTRATDADTNIEVTAGLETAIEEGSQADKMYRLTTNNPIVVDNTVLDFSVWGALIAHGQTTGRANDDHVQYARLAGRGASQELVGGVSSGNPLRFRSNTSDDGDIEIVAGSDLRMMGNNEFTPNVDGQGKLGTAAKTWGSIDVTTINSGDHRFKDPYNASNLFNMFEAEDGTLLLTGVQNGKTWLVGHSPREATEAELDRAINGLPKI